MNLNVDVSDACMRVHAFIVAKSFLSALTRTLLLLLNDCSRFLNSGERGSVCETAYDNKLFLYFLCDYC
jgi:hypothetical protein